MSWRPALFYNPFPVWVILLAPVVFLFMSIGAGWTPNGRTALLRTSVLAAAILAVFYSDSVWVAVNLAWPFVGVMAFIAFITHQCHRRG